MIYNFIIIFIILVITLTAAVIIVKLMRPGNKLDSPSRSWKTDITEHRKHPRIDVKWQVDIATPEGIENGTIRNIGIGGAFIVCENPLPINETTALTLHTPLEAPIILNGKAIWTNISVRDDNIVHKGMRIQFVHNPVEALKRLQEALVLISQHRIPDDQAPRKTGDYENRRDTRIDISWPVEMETSRGNMKAETRHVSISGAFISCQEPLPVNEIFRITIALPKQKLITVNAEVVWSNINVPEDEVVNRGMGIRFVNNSKEDLKPLGVALLKIVTGSFNPKD